MSSHKGNCHHKKSDERQYHNRENTGNNGRNDQLNLAGFHLCIRIGTGGALVFMLSMEITEQADAEKQHCEKRDDVVQCGNDVG